MQFSGNSVQKRVNSVQRKKQIRHSDRSIIKETHRQPIKCEPWMSQQIWKFASETMAGVLGWFPFATAAENTVKSTAFWLSVWKKWCLEKGIAKEIENHKPTQLKTLLEQSNAEIKNNHGQTSETTVPFHRKWFEHRLNNSLNCLAGLWTLLRLEDVKISLHIIVLIVRGCFDRTHGLNKLFLHLMRVLCLCLMMISHLVFFHVYYKHVITWLFSSNLE